MYSSDVLAKMMDYSCLRPHATRHEILEACEKAMEFHFASFCVLPCWVEIVCRRLEDSDVKVATVVGFPLGGNLPAVKAAEARLAIVQGADEIDMVMNIGALRSGDLEFVQHDIEEVVGVAQVAGLTQDGEEILTKVVIEACYLSRREKIEACRLIRDAGADFLKTCTGYGPSQATRADLRLLREALDSEVAISASGGVRTLEDVLGMIDAGANRVESPMAAEIIDFFKSKPHALRNQRHGRSQAKAEE